MCGIHGFINGKTKAELNSDDFIKSAFIANMLRGADSSGIAVVSSHGFSEVAKIPLAGMYLPSHKQAASLITRARQTNTASICHVRAATSGNITYSNAHPFVIEDEAGSEIVGVHNGTLQNWKTKKGGSDWDVDSAWALSRILTEKADAFEEFTGSFAFVWWTSENPDVLNMARNKERTLFIAYTEDDNLVYASEAGMIHWLCERHRIKLKGSIKELEEDRWYQFDISNPAKFTKGGHLPKPKVTSYSGGGGRSYYDTGWNNGTNYHQTTIEKLDRIFADIRAEDSGVQLKLVSNQDNQATALVTKEEVQNAHAMNMLGNKGVFTAMAADDNTGHIYGSYESLEAGDEMHAVMRDVPENIDWASGAEWMVKVHGIVDSGNDFIIVVSAPLDEAVPV